MADPNAALLAKLKTAFERDPLTSFFAVLVAANRVFPTEVIAIGKRQVMVPKWGAEGWRWWGQLARVMQDAAYAGNTPTHAVKLSSELDSLLMSDALQGDDFDPNAPPIYIDVTPNPKPPMQPAKANPPPAATAAVIQKSGSIVADVANWMTKNKAITTAVVAAALGFIVGGPIAWLAALLAWLAVNPDQLQKIFTVAGEMAGAIIGGVAKGLFNNPIALLALAAGAWYLFFRGGERHAD